MAGVVPGTVMSGNTLARRGPGRVRATARGYQCPSRWRMRTWTRTPVAASEVSGAPAGKTERVVIVGGTGRVGGSTARALVDQASSRGRSVHVVLAGLEANEEARALAAELGRQCAGCDLVTVDYRDAAALARLVEGASCVVHTAGPFQRLENTNVLEAAIAAGASYLDVCDDEAHSRLCRAKSAEAKAKGVRAMTSGGIYPGLSNLMARQLTDLVKGGPGAGGEGSGDGGGEDAADSVRFSYFTAGTGGAGATILASSFLLCGEPVTAFKDGEPVVVPAMDGQRGVDFGKKVGRRSVHLLNLPEVRSVHETLRVPSVSARFGTNDLWNIGMVFVSKLPASMLANREAVASLAKLLDPFVRAFDGLVGELTSIRVDMESRRGVKSSSVASFASLRQSVGQCTALFVWPLLDEGVSPGVWFPEEDGGMSDASRAAYLDAVAAYTINCQLKQSPWKIEGAAKQLAMGLYFDI